MNETPPIRARIHDSALRRVTRTFAATLGDIFTELFQNARRAGATRVRVAVGGPGDGGGLAVTVSDDGTGIADPAVLLSFGENGWSEDLVRREDAAGMGMLSLARRGCAVSSRPRTARADPAPGWRVALRPEHFLGAAEAPVRADDAAPSPHGTAVTFRTTQGECAEAVRTAAGSAAWHYPLPVVFAHPPHTPPGGEGLERRAFLDGALHAERWRGLVFGVFRDRWNGIGLGEPDLGFHGLTVPVGLPCVETIHGPRWTVAADVEDCPALELVLPARKEAVETAFLEEMRAAARRAIYRAMAAEADPCPAYEDWRRARDAGIDIAPPPAALRPWRPGIADIDHWREPPEHTPLGRDALVMDCEPEPPEAQALCRAAERSGLAGRLFETDPRLEGYPWYDALPRIVGQRTEVTLEGRPCALDAVPGPERTGAPEAPLPPRPETIRIGLRRAPGERSGAHRRPRRRSRLRGRSLVLARRRAAARHRARRARAVGARAAPPRRVLLALGRRGRRLLGAPARRVRPGGAAPRDAAPDLGRRGPPRLHRRRRRARALLAHPARARRRHHGARSDDRRDARRARRGGTMTRPFTVQCGYAGYYANTVTVEADTLDEALAQAIEAAERSDAWRTLDHCGDTFVAAVCEGTDADPWAPEAALPVPERFTERGESPAERRRGAGASRAAPSHPQPNGGPDHARSDRSPSARPLRPDAPPASDDEARKRTIACALRTEIHWLIPTDRTVTITVDGDGVAVAFGRPHGRPAPRPLIGERRP